jgi:alpha-glucosidase
MPSNPEVAAGGSIPWDGQEHRHDKDQPELHELLAEFRRIVDTRPGTATVGELFASGIDAAVAHWAPRHLVFDWVLLETAWTAASFRAAIAAREAAWSDRWPTIVLSNHDHSRHVSRYMHTLGRRDRATADAVAKAAATIELTLRGTPFLYYGEEIGAQDIAVPRSRARDRAAERMAGWWNRDGCRAPMAWSGDGKAGFSSGEPWLPIPPDAAFMIFVPALLFRTAARLDLAALPWRTLAAFFVPVLVLLLAVYGAARQRAMIDRPARMKMAILATCT